MAKDVKRYSLSGIKPYVNRYFHCLLFLLLAGCADPQVITEDAALGVIPLGAMPAAKPQTADTLKAWGLEETSPGVYVKKDSAR